jgi:hypothetical protein
MSPHALTVSVGLGGWNWESVTLRREEVRQVIVVRRLWWKYVRFVHAKRGVEEYVLFSTSPIERLLSELRAMGYPVA